MNEYPAFGDQLGHAGISAKGAAANGSLRNLPRRGASQPIIQGLAGGMRDRAKGLDGVLRGRVKVWRACNRQWNVYAEPRTGSAEALRSGDVKNSDSHRRKLGPIYNVTQGGAAALGSSCVSNWRARWRPSVGGMATIRWNMGTTSAARTSLLRGNLARCRPGIAAIFTMGKVYPV
jgi:hypothetical protein